MTNSSIVINKTNRLYFFAGLLSTLIVILINLYLFPAISSCVSFDGGSCSQVQSILLFLLPAVSIASLILFIADIVIIIRRKKVDNIKSRSFAKGSLISYVFILIVVMVFVIISFLNAETVLRNHSYSYMDTHYRNYN
jgi:hypothetical protein